MQYFECDYMEGCHPLILERLAETNMEKTPGYGTDDYCEEARRKIRRACECNDAEVHFMVGGTQTNATMITSLLRPYEGVIAAETGHINQHESGAIETGGHKVLALPHENGKLRAEDIKKYMREFYADETYPHRVAPGMVYLSHPTEYGTLYTRAELESIANVCRTYRMPLYLDGARLGYALAARDTDVSLQDIASLCDVFYIGGTKVGALFGEAVVIPRPGLVKGLFSIIKQHGALLAKGRLLGIQFDTLFTDNLYWKISRHAIDMAMTLCEALTERGYEFYIPPQTNQLFVTIDDRKLQQLAKEVSFSVWEKPEAGKTVIRFATSWATKEEDIRALIGLL